MNTVMLRFGAFAFPVNPQTVQASFSAAVLHTPVLEKNSVTERTAYEPAVISGSGRFYGEAAAQNCMQLARLLRCAASDWLVCPGVYPLRAYLSRFTYQLDADADGAAYSFTFTEDADGSALERRFRYTQVEPGETAFDIAQRCAVGVETLLRLNDLESPFDLAAGRRICVDGTMDV